MKFKNHFNSIPSKGETNTMPSETIPDQTLTIKEILDRHAKGIPLGGGKIEVWNGEEIVPDLRRMDLSEIADLKKANEERINLYQTELKKQHLKKQQEEFDRKVEMELQRREAEKQQKEGKQPPKTPA